MTIQSLNFVERLDILNNGLKRAEDHSFRPKELVNGLADFFKGKFMVNFAHAIIGTTSENILVYGVAKHCQSANAVGPAKLIDLASALAGLGTCGDLLLAVFGGLALVVVISAFLSQAHFHVVDVIGDGESSQGDENQSFLHNTLKIKIQKIPSSSS